MKKIAIALLAVTLSTACNNNETESKSETTAQMDEKSEKDSSTENSKTEDDKAAEVNITEAEKGNKTSHGEWNKLLKKHVDNKGMVDYNGMAADVSKLDDYLADISKNPPAKNWDKNEKMAYWINAYNAFTVKLILDHANEGIKSIKDIGKKPQIPFVNTPWDIKFINIGGQEYDLNNIEHGILRKQFTDPRFHFAIVCAAESCPRLRNEAFEGSKLDKQLDDEGAYFLNNKFKNDITEKKAKLSPLFKWYSKDWEQNGKSVMEWVNKYSDTQITDKTNIGYTDYSWKLNGKL